MERQNGFGILTDDYREMRLGKKEPTTFYKTPRGQMVEPK